ncbi:SDR family oxidoreductase [Microbacterium elymi]|uniref:SDR family oxidoreductase n=1 Tax=Microbacterium elymi TaxID=2909587 RepID=A0ABY5NHL6_9MICO|nr:SDR family oxidoreductase [Microbacterium elymi]UUT34678.1 SDR family oxidoreductase [Microbacterium elymi]
MLALTDTASGTPMRIVALTTADGAGVALVSFGRTGDTAVPFEGAGQVHVGFGVDDLDEAIDRAVARGATVFGVPGEVGPEGRRARLGFLRDPDGNVLELVRAACAGCCLMDLGVSGRVALVSGASRGIGRAIAIELAAEGAVVGIGYLRDADGARQTASAVAEAGGIAVLVGFDHTDPGSTRGAIASMESANGPVQILVNNAGAFPSPGPFSALSDDGWHAAIREQLEGPGNLIRAALPGMIATGWGRIVMISTVHALIGNPGVVAHTAAKSGLHGLTRSLARELGSEGILVNSVLPGLTLTEGARARFPQDRLDASQAAIPTGHASRPEEIAALVVFLASTRNGNITGELIRSAGGV